ncbi:MAG TPA: autotransporter outer membrane beta-barrel domain-containing protein [Steroidobacteraceae bacterium]|nr:autotransporter outer membrane beta-barrel domain-containing protein [Steroidobacteraceae bacterium]
MNNLPRRMIRSNRLLQAALCLAFTSTAQAQSLEDQYALFLGGKCDRMDFARDIDAILLPGQAGPRLKAYCDGLPPVGGVINSAATGSVSGAGLSAADDSARRRREAAQNENSEAKRGAQDFSVTRGNASAFLSLRYASEEQDATRYEGERDSDSLAATIGADYRFGSRGLAGLAIRFEDVSGDLARGGDFKSQAHGFSLYASLYPADNAFIDVSLNRNFRNDETHRVVSLERVLTQIDGSQSISVDIPAASLDSENDSRDFRAQLQAGYDFTAGGFTIGPRLGGFSVSSEFDAYGESGASPMTLVFDTQHESSLRSSVGVQASHAFTPSAGVFVLQANVDWLHEFQDDQRIITAHFAEDLRPNPTVLAFLNEAPDRNFYAARLSLSSVFRSGWAGFASVEGLLGHAYEQSVGMTLGIRKEL